MIELCRLNNAPLVVNALHILSVEQTPDTLVTLINGEKILVKNSIEEVIQRVTEYNTLVGRVPSVIPPHKPEATTWT